MKKLSVLLILFGLVVGLSSQTGSPSQITLKPTAASSACVADAGGDVLCAATDGFYVSAAGGPFQKVMTGSPAPPVTTITCTIATLSTGSTGNFTASGCTLK